MGITTHVLDTALGKPAANVPVSLYLLAEDEWRLIAEGITDADGRCRTLTPGAITAGTYKIGFDTSAYYAGKPSFYPHVDIVFAVTQPTEHHHVPLLVSPFGYSTYRGS